MNQILKHEDIDITNISIKKKININTKFINYPIKYNNKNLIIQTPIVYLPFGINTFNNKKYIDISFINSNNDKNMGDFKNIIVDINNWIKQKISKKNKFVTSFKTTEYYPDRLRLSFYDDILIFNESKHLISLDSIKSKIYTKLLITPQFLWKNDSNSSAGIVWNILQIKVYSKPILDTYSFIDTDEVNIDKYVKMLRCGVPATAIKNKMKLDNINGDLLNKFIHTGDKEVEIIKSNLKPKLKELKKTQSSKSSDIGDIGDTGFRMTMDQLKNIKLKKTNTVRVPPPFTHMNPFINIDELTEIKQRILS